MLVIVPGMIVAFMIVGLVLVRHFRTYLSRRLRGGRVLFSGLSRCQSLMPSWARENAAGNRTPRICLAAIASPPSYGPTLPRVKPVLSETWLHG